MTMLLMQTSQHYIMLYSARFSYNQAPLSVAYKCNGRVDGGNKKEWSSNATTFCFVFLRILISQSKYIIMKCYNSQLNVKTYKQNKHVSRLKNARVIVILISLYLYII